MSKDKIDHWADDLLGRKDDATFLYNFLIGQAARRALEDRSYVLNLDADWGNGKTFFIERFVKDLEDRNHIVVKINAWKDDYATDPYISIMAGIESALQPYMKHNKALNRAWKAAKIHGTAIAMHTVGAVAKSFLKSFTGIDANKVAKNITSDQNLEDAIEAGISTTSSQAEKLFDASLDDLIKSFNKTSDAMTNFRGRLATVTKNLPEEKVAPIFITIDELDRCKPIFAVQLLERIKHLFDIPNIIFVFSTNSNQLQYSISGLYGPGFDGSRYLKRFFDRTYVFEEPSIDEFVAQRINALPKGKLRHGPKPLKEVLSIGFKAYRFDLRAITQILEIFDTVLTAWNNKIPADICLLLPICANFYKINMAEWPSEAPSDWYYRKMIYSPAAGRPVVRGIDYARAYRDALPLIGNLSDASKYFSNRDGDQTNEYVRELFDPEWNGKHVEEGEKSIQADLVGLVANAGRMAAIRSS